MPVAPGWSLKKLVAMSTHFATHMATAEVYVNLWVLMHWYTGKSLLNGLERAVKQFAGCLAKEAAEVKVQQSCKGIVKG